MFSPGPGDTQPLNSPLDRNEDKGNENMWVGTEHAAEYGEHFNATIPTDQFGYRGVEYLVPDDAKVLDIGCSYGNFTRTLALGKASRVVGVDINPDAIREAQQRSSGIENVEFRGLSTEDYLKSLQPDELGTYDSVVLTFVDPVLSSVQELDRLIDLGWHALKPGGNIIFLRLNPNSIMTDSKYLFYGPRDIVGGVLKDGTQFIHTLTLPTGEEIELTDYYYSNEAMQNSLSRRGFGIIRNFLLYRNMSNGLGEVMQRTVESFERLYGPIKTDELGDLSSNPLYQIIQARKMPDLSEDLEN
jgi:2-polyprenyl-3-methyl-5-hydroxy-6-metoxy-1,4-benzoquinol methylase